MTQATIPHKISTADVLMYAVFFASGAAALVYEISWSRQIGILFGHTVHAAAVVVGGYFAGMGVGYLMAARLASRVRPLVGYAVAEWIVAAWACVIPFALRWLDAPLPAGWLHHSNASVQLFARATVCFVLLLPATTALGATLPFMAEYLSSRRELAAARVSIAYALNTAGALVGVVLATVALFLLLGVRGSGFAAAAISATCGLVACALSYVLGSPEKEARARSPEATPTPSPRAVNRRGLWLGLVALSGFGTLALEVLYTRAFALVFHNSTYTFGAVLTMFLAAIAIAAAVAPKLMRRYPADGLAAWACVLGAAAVVGSMFLFARLTHLEYYVYGESFAAHMAGVFGLVATVVLMPIALLAVILPVSWKGAERAAPSGGRVVGILTAANTFAATFGSLLAAFVLMPLFGLWPSFLGVALLFCLAGATLLFRRGAKAAAVVVTAAVILPGVASVQELHAIPTLPNEPDGEVLRRWETPYGWIDVVGIPSKNILALRENLHYVHGDTAQSVARESRQGHLPLLLHPNPREVLFLGLGTGLTAGAALRHPEVERVAVVELIPQVIEAARMFEGANGNLLEDPRTEIYVDDARHYLLATPRKFDMIISDLFVPWQSQTGYLYTVEHYKTARRRLKPGGFFCQWIALNQIGAREFEMIADSLASVFPVTTVWWGKITPGQSMVMLVASERAIELDGKPLAGRLARLNASGARRDPYVRSTTYVYRLFAGRWTVRRPGRLNTDERPRVEFRTPITYRNRQLLTRRALQRYTESVLAKLTDEGARFVPEPGAELESLTAKHSMQREILRMQMQGPKKTAPSPAP